MTGCKSMTFGPYVSPEVTGQVVAMDKQQPLAGVRIARGHPETYRLPGPPPKGGELLMRKPAVQTDHNGRFVLSSERVLSVIRGAGWDMIELDFSKEGYEPLHTNFSIALATNATAGKPFLDAGKIFLKPERSE
jgi:hypothetical protein